MGHAFTGIKEKRQRLYLEQMRLRAMEGSLNDDESLLGVAKQYAAKRGQEFVRLPRNGCRGEEEVVNSISRCWSQREVIDSRLLIEKEDKFSFALAQHGICTCYRRLGHPGRPAISAPMPLPLLSGAVPPIRPRGAAILVANRNTVLHLGMTVLKNPLATQGCHSTTGTGAETIIRPL